MGGAKRKVFLDVKVGLLVGSSTLGLVLGNGGSGTPDLLSLVLGLLHGLSGSFLPLNESLADLTVQRLELAQRILVLVDQAEPSALSSSELGLESEKNNQLRVGLVHASDNLLELRPGHIRASRVDHLDDHL